VSQVAFAHGGQFQLASGSLQQARAQAFFQFGDTPRQPRLGNAQQTPGRREAAGFHHLGEIIKVIEVLHG
jgi:hypothetical protein